MSVTLWVIVGVLGTLLLAASSWSFWVGIVGFFAGGEIQRCADCHHIGIAGHGRFHAEGCPAAHHLLPVHLGHHHAAGH